MKVYLHYRMLEFIIISSKENEGCNVYFFIETLLGFIDIYLLCVFSGCFFERKDNKKNIILVVLYFVSTFKTFVDFEHISGIWSILALILYILLEFVYLQLIYQDSVLQKGLFIAGFTFLGAFSELILLWLGIFVFDFSIVKVQEHGIENIGILLLGKGILVLLLLCMVGVKKKVSVKMQGDNAKAVFFMTGIDMLIIMLTYLLYRNMGNVTKEALFVFMGGVLFLIVGLNIVVFYNMLRTSEKNYQVSLQLQYMHAQKQQNTNMEALVQNLRQLRHDMNNHMGILYGLCDTKQYDVLQQYLKELIQETKEINEVIVVPNQPVLSIILNNKRALAQKKGINLTYAAQTEDIGFAGNEVQELPLTELEQCSLFGNILDNAIEACEKIAISGERLIHLTLGEKENGWHIMCKNSYFEKPICKGNYLITQKSDAKNHGIGTRTMRGIIEKYNGKLEYRITEETFIVDIYIQKALKGKQVQM